jgi:hypothetical protein
MENECQARNKSHHCAVKIIGLSILLLLFSRLPISRADTDHGFITTYEGSKTCRTCHEAAVDDLTHALHYRMLGQVQGVYNMFTNKPVTGEQGKGNRY